MTGKKELMDKIDKITSERQEARAKLLGAEGRINELDRQIESLMIQSKERGKTILELTDELEKKEMAFEIELDNLSKDKQIGFMTVEVPNFQNAEQSDTILKLVKERIDDEMKEVGIDMDWIIMPSIVKEVKTIIANTIKKEE